MLILNFLPSIRIKTVVVVSPLLLATPCKPLGSEETSCNEPSGGHTKHHHSQHSRKIHIPFLNVL